MKTNLHSIPDPYLAINDDKLKEFLHIYLTLIWLIVFRSQARGGGGGGGGGGTCHLGEIVSLI